MQCGALTIVVLAQMVDVLSWCLDLGVTCVSVFAFSIENFRRDPQEVAMLMDLAEQKLDELLQVLADLLPRQFFRPCDCCSVMHAGYHGILGRPRNNNASLHDPCTTEPATVATCFNMQPSHCAASCLLKT